MFAILVCHCILPIRMDSSNQSYRHLCIYNCRSGHYLEYRLHSLANLHYRNKINLLKGALSLESMKNRIWIFKKEEKTLHWLMIIYCLMTLYYLFSSRYLICICIQIFILYMSEWQILLAFHPLLSPWILLYWINQ